uniref:Myotubularin-related protein MTM-9 (projected from Caenorhabditis elegans ortholog mtm-9) n=1 Tax=Strongyloides venezuelensis TaxID=75913 RepID=A0A0K0F2Q0_STRVS
MELVEIIEKPRINNVYLKKGPRRPQIGSIALVGHHFIFIPKSCYKKEKKDVLPEDDELWLLHRAIDKVEIKQFKFRKNNGPIEIGGYLYLMCKNFLIVIFQFFNIDDCQAVGRNIETLSNITGFTLDYPFYYQCPFKPLDNGWTSFSVDEQYAKLILQNGQKWRISSVNENFTICSTYPEKIIVPVGNGDDYIKISATFRAECRFPILAYYHSSTNSTIIRCGQPLVGPTNRRCKEDEVIVNSFLAPGQKGIIYDTRPKTITFFAQGLGGGTESKCNYPRWGYVNGKLPKIREIHDALTKTVSLCNNMDIGMDKWFKQLRSAGWLEIVLESLKAAATVAQLVDCECMSVMIHGADGLDTTLLVTSVAILLLDTDSRTIRGFEALIEREWIMAGHPFSIRCTHSAYATGSITKKYESPVFLLFLDCVWQIMRQYPASFEFNEDFLLVIFEHAYASEFGSFLGNCEREKKINKVKELTTSLWSYINHPEILVNYVSPAYEPNPETLWPSVAPQVIVFWDRLFKRWRIDWKQTDQIQQIIKNIKNTKLALNCEKNDNLSNI